MELKPHISILVANYNNGKYFADCYQSLIDQTFKDWECIIVDDCSTDDSVNIIQNLTQGDPRFKIYINDTNQGVGFTKKRGVDLAQARLCTYIDPDDAIVPHALQLMYDAHQDENITLAYSNFIYCDAQLQPTSVRKTEQVENNNPEFFNHFGVISHLAVFKREQYNKTNGLNITLKRAIDQDLYLKLYDVGAVKYIDEDLYRYRIHDGGISTNENAEKAQFWHWVAILDTCKRRGLNPELYFIKDYIPRTVSENQLKKIDFLLHKISLIKKSKWMKLGAALGFIKNYNKL